MNVYGDVFGKIAVSAMVSAVICLILSPLLCRWMHREAVADVIDEDPHEAEGADPGHG